VGRYKRNLVAATEKKTSISGDYRCHFVGTTPGQSVAYFVGKICQIVVDILIF